MKWSAANAVVEELRRDTRLYLPALTQRRGFSSSRVEHLLNGLVKAMPRDECYLEIGTLEGRTLEAAAVGNDGKTLIGVDPCEKYETVPADFPSNVAFVRMTWQEFLKKPTLSPVGLVFYDGLHDADETMAFMYAIEGDMADEGVLVLDDWDRTSVREGAFRSSARWRLLRECPEYSDGLTCQPQRFGYSFGISVWGFKR